jgi:hypothetical protein
VNNGYKACPYMYEKPYIKFLISRGEERGGGGNKPKATTIIQIYKKNKNA